MCIRAKVCRKELFYNSQKNGFASFLVHFRQNAHFIYGDLEKLTFSIIDICYAYLKSPVINLTLVRLDGIRWR